MAFTFTNPVMAGPNLARPVLQSPNFSIGGQSGWAIFQSGLAYFFDVILSGGVISGPDWIINDSGIFFYAGTPAAGNLVFSVTTSSGADGFGNPYSAGVDLQDGNQLQLINAAGQKMILQFFGGVPNLGFVSGLASETIAGQLTEIIFGSGTASQLELAMIGPAIGGGTGNGDNVEEIMVSGSQAGSFAGKQFLYQNPVLGNALVALYGLGGFIIEMGAVTGLHPGTGVAGTAPAAETWQNLAVPATWTGRYRVKVLAEQRFAVLDLNITGGTTNPPVLASLPAGYFPSSDTSEPLGFSGANAGTNARINLTGGGGAVGIAGLPAVLPGRVSATILYPLD